MHGKASSFAPAFARWLDAAVRSTAQLDTDALGTFTGDVPRALSRTDAATAKATAAAHELGTALGLATEASYAASWGGFGPLVHEELGVVVDLDRGIRVVQSLHGYSRLPAASIVRDAADVRRYLARVGFPTQGVVARSRGEVHKDLRDESSVLALIGRGELALEPDLRAHHNPERRRTLRRLAWMLAARIRTPCPACGCPGFGPVRIVRGVPCAACDTPTALVRADVEGCASCPEHRERPRPLARADPASCDACNP